MSINRWLLGDVPLFQNLVKHRFRIASEHDVLHEGPRYTLTVHRETL